MADPMVDWKAAIGQFADRLERDYRERIGRYARGLDVWGNSTTVGYDIPLGGRIGRSDGGIARYAKRTGFLGMFGPRIRIRELADIEAEFRREIGSARSTWKRTVSTEA
jgi:hypothetical protein